ncbi:hypothetical protein NE237_003944 [Protea cynaroides]|uniref:HSF-type DNA-binding domain-containing protein n=1 Tax=Protea cynaroides TaxID=273540 RepID=A0A9Q0QT33_9MAGN|nr:hypothetical protein NE237_003944 [Protea cynaroides]
MDPREKHYPPQSTADIASATLESGLTVTQSSVCSYLSSPLMDFEGLSSGESSILPGLSSSSSSASPSTEIEECSATNHIVPMETESKGSFSSSPRLGTEVGGAGVRPTSVTGGASKREFIGIPQPLECRQGNPVPPFLSKTYALVEDKSLDPIISWGSSGESFVVWDVVEFARAVLPQNFKHNNFSSFVRQLNTYGFHKIDTDRWEFANEKFVWGKRHLLKNIRRRKSSQSEQIESYSESSVEEGKSGLESEIGGLRDEKNLMMQEVVNLQQEHRGTAEQLEAMKQRLQTAEQRQKQMVSFVAKLLQNPVFLTRFQQKGEHKEVTSSRVRRKFIKQQQHPDQVKQESSMGGRIVKYRPDWNSIPTSLGTQESGPVERQLSDHILEEMGSLQVIPAFTFE